MGFAIMSKGGGGSSDKNLQFGETDGLNGFWDKQSGAPTGTQPIRYNGFLRATRVYGMYFSDDADFAEEYQIEGEFEPGDLIQITSDGKLIRNDIGQNTKVIGIVSTDPAFVAGEGSGNAPIALMGRIPAKVMGGCTPGDYLTASGTIPGALEVVPTIEYAKRGSIVAQALEFKDTADVGLVTIFVVRM